MSRSARPRLAWMALAFLAIVAYRSIVAPCEARLDGLAFRARELERLAERNERLQGQSAEIAAARRRVADDLARLSGRDGSARASLAAIAHLQRLSDRYHLSVAEVRPESERAPGAGYARIVVGLRGRYADIVAVLSALSRGDVLLEATGVRLNSSRGANGSQSVDASVRAIVYHGVDALGKEPNLAQTDSH